MRETEAQSSEARTGDALSDDEMMSANPLSDGSDATRTAILDAVVRCFAAQGWAGTNMSLVARETGMTRGKIQYYFPVLDELKFAAIEYLYDCWRRSYFDRISPDASARARFDKGVDLLWDLARDPLHVAMSQLEAAARTDEGLRRRLSELHVADEEELKRATTITFPALAAVGPVELQLGRYFTTIFINGLAAHGFPHDAAIWQKRLVAMLKECLTGFWVRRGVLDLDNAVAGGEAAIPAPAAAAPDPAEAERKRRALALLQEAAEILSDGL